MAFANPDQFLHRILNSSK